jgi:hypothetical protein
MVRGLVARDPLATQELSYFNKFGQLIYSEKRGIPAGYKWPQAIQRLDRVEYPR